MGNVNLGKQNTYPQIRQSDLKDPTLFALNTSITFLYSQIDKLQNASSIAPGATSGGSLSGGIAGQVLTSNGASPATFQNLPTPTATFLSAAPAGPYTTTAGYVSIPGMAVTLNKDGLWLITATLDVSIDNSSLAIFGKLVVNSVDQTGLLRFANNATSSGSTITRSWLYPNTGTNIAVIQGKSAFAAGSRTIDDASSILIAEFKG